MTQSFSFGFRSDDMEEDGDEVVEVEVEVEGKIGPSHDTSENRPVAVTEPKLHRLQDLV